MDFTNLHKKKVRIIYINNKFETYDGLRYHNEPFPYLESKEVGEVTTVIPISSIQHILVRKREK